VTDATKLSMIHHHSKPEPQARVVFAAESEWYDAWRVAINSCIDVQTRRGDMSYDRTGAPQIEVVTRIPDQRLRIDVGAADFVPREIRGAYQFEYGWIAVLDSYELDVAVYSVTRA
jgi:hypothetical protein